MKHWKASLTVLVTAITLFVLHSCSDEETIRSISAQEERELAELSTSHDAIVDAELFSFDDMIAEMGGGRHAASCPIVTRHEANKTIIIDFGSGCTGSYGRIRSGKVIITYAETFGDHLANRVISFENYFVNAKQITGTLEVRDFNLHDSGNPTLTRRYTDLRITFPDGRFFTANGSVTIAWITGFGDGEVGNNMLEITGSFDGISSRGLRVTREIKDPLVLNFSCLTEGGFATVEGRIEMTIEGLNRERSRIVEFGDGNCDDIVKVTINGKEYTIAVS